MSNILNLENLGTIKNKNYNFYYRNKKEFKKYKKDNSKSIKIIGSTTLKCVAEEKLKQVDTYLCTYIIQNKPIYFRIKRKHKICYKKGYIHLGNNQFIVYESNRIILLILLLFLMISVFSFEKNSNGKLELDDFIPIDLENNVETELKYYDFQPQGEYNISSTNSKIKVWNPETNTRIFQYDIYIDNELFHQTKGIMPGNMIEIDCSSLLDKIGEHTLILELSVVDEETGVIVGKAQRNAILNIQ